MKRNTKLYVTTAAIVVIVLSVFVPAMAGTVNAQETGEQSATIEYDYENESVDYQLNNSLFKDYSLAAPNYNKTESFSPPSGTVAESDRNIQWADNGNRLYLSEGTNIHHFTTTNGPYEMNGLQHQETFSRSANITDFQIGDSGYDLYYVLESDTQVMHDFSLSNTYNLGSTYFGGSVTFDELSGGIDSFHFLEDGSGLFTVSDSGLALGATELSSNWDYTTAGEINDYRSMQRGSVQHIVATSPTEVYYMEGQTLVEGTLNNPFDFSQSVNVKNQYSESFYTSFTWANSGNELHGVEPGGNDFTIDTYYINQYEGSIQFGNGSMATDTQTLNKNGSISYEPIREAHNISLSWNAISDESYNGTSNAISFYGQIPIRSATTQELITNTVSVTAYSESGIYTFNTTSGYININELPNQPYTFSVRSDGYSTRNRYSEQLGTIETFYLLSNDTNQITSQFQLQDRTGTYNQESRLVIRRPISGNWETIVSESFGISGISTELQENIRYRLYIETDDQMQLIGTYSSSISEVVTVSPASGEIEIGDEEYWSAGASYSDQEVNARFVDPTGETDTVSVTVYERGNESNTLVTDDTYSNPSELQLAYAVPDQYNESNWIVELEITRGSETYTTTFNVGPTANIVPSELDEFWRKIVAISLMLCFGMVFSVANKAVGSIVYACIGGMFYWIGLLEGLTTAALVTAYFFIVIIYNIYMKS